MQILDWVLHCSRQMIRAEREFSPSPLCPAEVWIDGTRLAHTERSNVNLLTKWTHLDNVQPETLGLWGLITWTHKMNYHNLSEQRSPNQTRNASRHISTRNFKCGDWWVCRPLTEGAREVVHLIAEGKDVRALYLTDDGWKSESQVSTPTSHR